MLSESQITRYEEEAKKASDDTRLGKGIRHSKVIRADECFKYVGEIPVEIGMNSFA